MRKIIAALSLLMTAQAFAADKLSITELRRADSNGLSGVQGIAHNETGQTLSSATIIFKLVDSAGNMVGNAAVTGYGLGPDQDWRFIAPAPVKFYSAEVVQVMAN